MLALPEKGLSRSASSHNVDFDMLYDWVEASALFCGEPLVAAEVVDLLRENEIYATQDLAWELLENLFAAIEARANLLGKGYPIRSRGTKRIEPKADWQEFPAYSFCLMLSLRTAYPTWARSFGQDYTRQGDLFERLTAESVSSSFRDWTVCPTGWTKEHPGQLGKIVVEIAEQLGEPIGTVERWTSARAKEAGLDLLCFRRFPDRRGGLPVFLFQCASGADWKSKLHTPNIRIWTKVITFSSDPKKAFSMPYALDEIEFNRNANIVDGLLLDRHRLLAPGFDNKEWISDVLATDLNAWTSSRVPVLPLTTSLV